MSADTATPAAPQQIVTQGVSQQTARLLSAGIVAGPLFLVVWALQAFTRDEFDPGRHPISLLSLGDLGWIQIANFVVTGALFVACAVGLRRVLHPGPGGTWGPRLSWTAVCFVLRARFVAVGQRGWARRCVAAVVAALVVSGWPDADSFTIAS